MDGERSKLWRRVCGMVLCAGVVGMTGCKSPYVEADVINATGKPVSLLEVDYPSASFGAETLAAGATYHYRFKILGDGGTKVDWTDAAHKEHKGTGPSLTEGQQGSLTITLEPDQARWKANLH
jgi:hypothetical protein